MNIYIQCRIFAHVQVKLHERNFNFCQLPRNTIHRLKAYVGGLYNICFSYFLSEQFAYRNWTKLQKSVVSFLSNWQNIAMLVILNNLYLVGKNAEIFSLRLCYCRRCSRCCSRCWWDGSHNFRLRLRRRWQGWLVWRLSPCTSGSGLSSFSS